MFHAFPVTSAQLLDYPTLLGCVPVVTIVQLGLYLLLLFPTVNREDRVLWGFTALWALQLQLLVLVVLRVTAFA